MGFDFELPHISAEVVIMMIILFALIVFVVSQSGFLGKGLTFISGIFKTLFPQSAGTGF